MVAHEMILEGPSRGHKIDAPKVNHARQRNGGRSKKDRTKQKKRRKGNRENSVKIVEVKTMTRNILKVERAAATAACFLLV